MEAAFFKEASVFGVAGLMFLAYYILHQSTFSTIRSMMEQMKEANTASIKSIAESFDRVSQRQKDAEERNYLCLKELTETLQMTVAAISRLDARIGHIESHISQIQARKGGK